MSKNIYPSPRKPEIMAAFSNPGLLSYKRTFFVFLLLFFGFSGILVAQQISVYSDHESVIINSGRTITYCYSDGVDELFAIRNSGGGGGWYTEGVFDGDGIGNHLSDWDHWYNSATFDPKLAGVGNHTITFIEDGHTGRTGTWTFIVEADPTPTLVLPNNIYCSDNPAFTLSGGTPADADGTYYVNDVPATTFNPSTRGEGTYKITYSVGTTHHCYAVSAPQYISVIGAPTFTQPSPICDYSAPVNLTLYVSPQGGTFDGPGVDPFLNTFDPSAVTSPGSFTIGYTYVNGGCTDRVESTIQVLKSPDVSFSGLNTSYCEGASDVTLIGTPTGGTFTGPAGSIVSTGSGTAIFRPSALSVGGPYAVSYTYTNAAGCTNTETKNVIILSVPTAYLVTGSGSYCEDSGGLTVSLSGSEPGINYLLYVNGTASGASVPGTGAAITTAWTGKTTGTYTVAATNAATGCSENMNGSAVIVELPKAAITSSPVDATVCENSTAVFTVTATGQNLTYSWTMNGAAVGENSNILAINNVSAADAGLPVICTVTSSCPSGYSSATAPVTINVNPATTITSHPAGIEKCTGTSHTFTVAAGGVNNTYRWMIGSTNIVETAGKYVNVNTANLTVLNLNSTDAGNYRAYVEGDCGNEVQSNPAALIVDDPIAITSQPSSVVACTGSNVAFNIAATGTNLSYQWYFNNGTGFVTTGTGSQSLAINGVSAANAGTYYCIITSPCGATATTNSVTLRIPAVTSVLTAPAGGTICEGENFNFQVVATGDNLHYEWYKDGILLTDNAIVSNSSTSNLILTGATTAYSGNYTVIVTGTCGTEYRASALAVRQSITFVSQPVSQPVCEGSYATFSVNVNGDVLAYQWQFNSSPIAGATGSGYTINNATSADAGNYRCQITTSDCGLFYSQEATLSVNPLTTITTQPVASMIACVGGNVSFSVVASGIGLTYQWYKDGTSLGAGYTNATLNIPVITAADAGSYICYVTGTCGPTVLSNSGILTVDNPTVISNHPQSQTVCLNLSHELTVTLSSGTNPVYQWYFNGSPVGGNSPVYSIPAFTATDEGDYYCIITNGCGAVTSQTATLQLVNTFALTGPVDVNVCQNGTASYTVSATASDVSYQWMRNGAVIAGATSSSLIINNVTSADNGNRYSCEVTNGCGTTTSYAALLTVLTPLNITRQPESGIACIGQPYSIIINVSGSNPAFQWYRTSTGLIPGATNMNYTFSSFTAGDADTYYCIVTNDCSNITSGSAVITAGEEITITDPAPLTRCTGTEATFTINAATGTNLQYEWRKNDVPITDDARIAGSTTNSLTIKDIEAGDEGTYNIIVTGACGLARTSAGAYLDVTTVPEISVGPLPQTVCSGNDASFSITVPVVTGDPLPSYVWQRDGVNIDQAANPSAATSTLIIAGATAADEGIYRCIVTNSCGPVTSTSAELILEENLDINDQPDPVIQCEGTNAVFTVGVTGPTNMVLQWYKDGSPLTEGAHTSGVNISTLTVNNITDADNGSYWCEIVSMCGNTVSNSANLTVHNNISVTQQPQSITVCPGTTLNLNITTTGTVITYQWQRNGVNVGTNSPTYTVSSFVPGTDNGNYICEITNLCGTVVSDIAVVTAGVPTVATISGDQTACEGQNASFSVTATGSNLTYQWYLDSAPLTDGTRIGGSQTSSLTINGLIASDGGTYQCDVSGACGFDNDNIAVLTVQENISVDVEPASISALTGSTATFTAVASGNITGYQWYKGTTQLNDIAGEISGATSPVLNLLNVQADDAGDYMCVIAGVCGNVNSKTATLNILTSSLITTQPATPVALCEGSSLSLFIVASGTGHTYQWRIDDTNLSDGVNISGATTSSLTINNTTTANTGAYTCMVDGSEISHASIVIINPTTVINVNPAGGNKCEGDTHVFSVTADGTNLHYQWYKDNTSTPVGTDSNEYTLSPLSVADNGTYFCVVTGACGIKQSSGATLTVNINTVINVQPAATTICQGATATLSIDVTGSALTYLWKKNGQAITEGNISGITTNTLQISNGVPGNSGDYTCTVSGACGGDITSTLARVTVNPATVITTQPIGRTTCEGDGVVFTVEATGSNLTYDWRLNGTSLGLASNPTLIINGLVKATDEGTYTCMVTGDCGTIISDAAVLTINRNTVINAPVISANPICQNGSATITINATGDGLTYLWKKNGQAITGTNISGITTGSLVISNALTADAGVYTCTVTGACGSPLTSSNAVLTVNPTTVITSQPSNFTKCAGDLVLFTVAADGENLNYQWRRGGAAGTVLSDGVQPTGSTVSGAATNQLIITGITAADAGSYACVITGTCGNVNSNAAVLTVNVPVQITTQPLSLTTICQDASTSIALTASGTVTSYRWKMNGNYLNNGGSISGVTTNNLIVSNALLTDAGFYSCEILGACNIVNSQSAQLEVNRTTRITRQPAGATLCAGDNVQFMVMAEGTEPLTYQWMLNNVNVPGANSSTLSINNITSADAGAYTCLVAGASTCGTATSNPANLIVNPAVNITTQPVNVTVCKDNTAIFSLNATGTNLTYRWKYNEAYITDNGRITGATTNELNIAFATNADEGIYKCEIFSNCGTRESSSAVLAVTDSTKIATQPLSQTLLQGTTATFNVTATGEGLTYQWQKDNVDIIGATSASYSIAGVQPADIGSYRSVVSGNCGEVTSNIAILTVNQPVSITTQPAPLSICEGESASFAVVATGTIVSYQWVFNGADVVDGNGISGAKTANLVISPAVAVNDGYYSCIITGSNNTVNSNEVQLTVNIPVSITQQPLTQTKCDGDILVLEVTPDEPTSNYSWSYNGNPPLVDGGRISGATTGKLVITGVSAADAGSYRCTVSNICATVTSNPAVVTINQAVTITTEPSSLNQCEGQTAFFSVAANIATVNYQWYKNGVVLTDDGRITGANTNNLSINNLVLADQGSYSCLISENCSTVNSATAVLTVEEVVVIRNQPSDKTACEGENTYLEVTATGDNMLYQWQKDGIDIHDAGNISGTGSSILIIGNATVADQGVYRCNITGDCNTILSNTSNLSINALPGAAGIISGSNTVCQGSKSVLYVVQEIPDATSYVWEVPYGATIVNGLGTRSVQVDYANNSLSGVVTVHGVNNCGSGAASPALAVTVNHIPVAAAGPDQIICSGTTTFNANSTIYGTWTRLSGLATIANPNISNSSVTNIGQGNNLFLWTVSENGCVAQDSVIITNRVVDVDAGPDQTTCSMSSTMNANTPVVGSGSWSVITGGGIIANNSNPQSHVSNLARGTNILRWSINNSGCVSHDDVAIVNDLPDNAHAGRDTVLVVNHYTLNGNNPAIGNGYWTLLSGSATITNPSQYNTTVTNLGLGDNIFQWTITNNMCSSQDEVVVTNYTPTLTDAGPAQTLCNNYTTLQGTIPNYGTGEWSVVSGSGTFVNPSRFDTEVTDIGNGQNIFRWTIYEYRTTFDDVVITNNSPSKANAGIDRTLCADNTTLAGNRPDIGTGEWTVTGGSGVIANTSLYNSSITFLGSGANTFKWTITNNGCTSDDEVVIRNNRPTIADAGVDQVICADSVNLYPNTPSVGVGEWSIVQGAALFKDNKVYNLARGENYLKWTINNNGCFDSDTVIITNNMPTASFTGEDRYICVDSIFLPGNLPVYGTGEWTKLSGSADFTNIHDPKSKVNNLSYGQNRFRWTITYNGCSSSSEVDIYYNYIQAEAGADQVICQTNALLNATDQGNGTGQWSVVGGFGSANFLNPNQSNTEVTNLDRGNNVLRWTITNHGCVSYDEVIITNNTPSQAYAGADRSICGEDIILNANNPGIGTGEWTVLSGSANIANPRLYNTKVSGLSLGQNILRWTVANAGCSSSDEVVIRNNQPANIEAGQDQYICSDTVQLYSTVPVGGSGRWSISQGSATFENSTLYNSRAYNLQKGENKFVWTVTIASCSNSDTVVVQNNMPSTPSAGPDQDICDDKAIMAANQPLIGTGSWSIVSGSAVFENIKLPGTKVSDLGNGPNILRWTINNGSCVLFDEVTIQNSLPTIAYAGEDRSVCNSSANLLANIPYSGTGSWSVVSGEGTFTNPNSYNSEISDLGFGANTLRWTTESGRCRTSDDVIITNDLAEVNAGDDRTVYVNYTRLVGNKPASGTGQWIILAGKGTIENPSNFETNVNDLGSGANTFSWTINNNSCVATDNVIITYRKLPDVDFNPLPAKGCQPLTVNFINKSVGGSPYHWDFGDGTTSNDANTDHTYYSPGNYTVRLTGTGPDGITLSKDTVIVVREVPVAQFNVTPDTAYIPGQSVNFFNLTNNIDSVRWEFGDGNYSNEMNANYTYTTVGSYDVTLHVWSGAQCHDSLMVQNAVTVELAGIIKCPNAFTPNLDGPTGGYYSNNDFSNDVFHCYIEGVIEYHLEIYNRLGIRLFRSDDQSIGWDGYFKGKLVEEGAYVYKVYGRFNNGKTFNYVGNVVLLH